MPTKNKQPCIHHRWNVSISAGSVREIEIVCLVCQYGIFDFWEKEIAALLHLAQELAPERLTVILNPWKQSMPKDKTSG